jgi:hypothetical protein
MVEYRLDLDPRVGAGCRSGSNTSGAQVKSASDELE